jgi:small subunit ribosomal protein S5
MDNRMDMPSEFFEKVVQVNRVSKKGKGGDKRSVSVIVVVGDRKGKVGVGLGKSADVQSAVRKASAYAKKHLIEIPLYEQRTITHDQYVKLGAARVIIKPAPAGTGVIAGGAVRVVVEAAGVHDIVSKVLGTNNRASNVYATLKALSMLKPRKEIAKKDESGEEKKKTSKKKEAKS